MRSLIVDLLRCAGVWLCYCHCAIASPTVREDMKGCTVLIKLPSEIMHRTATILDIPHVCKNGDTLILNLRSAESDIDSCKIDDIQLTDGYSRHNLVSQSDIYKESLTRLFFHRPFICESQHQHDPSRLLSKVLFCHPCHGEVLDSLRPTLELLPLPVPSSKQSDYTRYAVSFDGAISGLLSRQYDSPEADDAARGLSLHEDLVISYRQQNGDGGKIGEAEEEEEGLRLGVVRVSTICKADGVQCVYMPLAPSKGSPTSISSPTLSSSPTTPRLKRNHDQNDSQKNNGGDDEQQAHDSGDTRGTEPSMTQNLVPITPPTSPPTSYSSSIHFDASSVTPEAADSPGTFTPNFITDPQTRKIFRSLAIVALIICLKWLLFKYIQRTTAYRRRRADLLSRTEERRRGWRYRNAARRYRLNMWVRRQVGRVGRSSRRGRGENRHTQTDHREGNGGGTASTTTMARNGDSGDAGNNYSAVNRGLVPNGSTRPPLMEDEISNFRRVLEYVGELVRGDAFYDSYSFSSHPSDDLEYGYDDSDISMSDYNYDNNGGRENSGGNDGGGGGGNSRRPNQRSGFVNIAWRYGYAPRRFATPPPSSIAQLTTFDSPPTSDTETEGEGGRGNDNDGDVSDDGTFVTGIEDEDAVGGGSGGRASDEIDLDNMSVSDEGLEETDMLIARAKQLGVK